MLRIHKRIQSREYPNASTLARELEVSTKSIQRDVEFMRDRLDLPLEYDGSRFGYFYSEEVESFPTVQITEGELVALLVAEKALQQYRGTSFEKPLVSAFKKMSASLPETISLNLADWDQTISFRTSAEPLIDLARFDALAKAAAQHQQIVIHYRKPGRREIELRTIDPYHLANVNGEWFLFGFDHLRNDIRTFAPSRITQVERTGKKFSKPERFSLEKRLHDSFGIHSGNEAFDIQIRFDAAVADFIREKKWHPSQSLIELPDGEVELRLKLSSLVEIERWVLNWGGRAVVLQPAKLAMSIRQAAREILRRYGESVSVNPN
ncbi:MAG: WYL domain-containing protein [Verrucomicrobia bacterium]|nr:WYL domain-containing protein [Verrucomicrobiota bacterium]